MIGLYRRWSGDTITDDQARRFAASLGAGLSRAVACERDDVSILASLCDGAAAPRGWRAARTPGGDSVLFTGYLDHPHAMAAELGLRSGNHAQLYAAGHARWGDEVDLRMLGQFATLLLSRDKAFVRCARSPIFAPPLHVWHDAQHVAVASVARALFATGEVTAEVDDQKITDSLRLDYGDPVRGWYRGVMRVPVGSHVILDPDGRRDRRYYDLAAIPPVVLTSDDAYVAAANALLMEGVRAALADRHMPAVSLSGGLDSQAVAACALEVLDGRQTLLGLTAIPEPGWSGRDTPATFADERPHVASLAAIYPALATATVDAAGLSFDHLLPAMFLMAGAPPRNTMNLHWIHALRAAAKARGCDVLLIGQMGNHGFSYSGAGALPSWFARGAWRRVWRELRAMRDGRSIGRRFLSNVLMPLLPERLGRSLERLRSGRRSRRSDWHALPPDHPDAPRASTTFRRPRSTAAYRRAAFAQAMNEGGDVRQALDLIHGIPTRDPTAYRPLLEFCLAIPDDQYLRDGTPRWLARRMMAGRLPAMVLDERRRGRQAADWRVRIGRQRGALLEELDALADDPAMRGRIDLERLRHALERGLDDPAMAGTLELALPRAIATARFVRFVEGANRR